MGLVKGRGEPPTFIGDGVCHTAICKVANHCSLHILNQNEEAFSAPELICENRINEDGKGIRYYLICKSFIVGTLKIKGITFNIDPHFIEKIEDRFEINGIPDDFIQSVMESYVIENRPKGLISLLKAGGVQAVYLLNKPCDYLIVLQENNQRQFRNFKTIYRASMSGWATGWLNKTPRSQRIKFKDWLQNNKSIF